MLTVLPLSAYIHPYCRTYTMYIYVTQFDILCAQCQFPFTAVEAQNYTACTIKVCPLNVMVVNILTSFMSTYVVYFFPPRFALGLGT